MRALWLSLRRQSVTPARFRPLEAWIEATLAALSNVEGAAASADLDLSAPQLMLDGRETSLDISLAMLRHNLVEEYPRLIRLDDPHSMTVVQSSNLNDHYRIGQFADAPAIQSAAVRRALDDLRAQLEMLPASDQPPSDH